MGVSMILDLISWAILAIGLAIGYVQARNLNGKDVTLGTVTDLAASRSGRSSTTSYRVVAEFKDGDGHAHTYRAGFSSSSPGYKKGDPIKIYFDRENPEDCGVCSFGYSFGVAWIITLVGAFMLIAKNGWVIGNRIMESWYPVNLGN